MDKDQAKQITAHLRKIAEEERRHPLDWLLCRALDPIPGADGMWLSGGGGDPPVARWISDSVLVTACCSEQSGEDGYLLRLKARPLQGKDWSIALACWSGRTDDGPPGVQTVALKTKWTFRMGQEELAVEGEVAYNGQGSADEGERFARLLASRVGWKVGGKG